ncbi:hypothetical protein [Deinococcus yavapaiensis]|nr:hypothetical protein [Deinococcus yavapaiensis]
MSDETKTTDEATTGHGEGSGLTKVRPGEAHPETSQGGTGASGNALESEPDSAREKIQNESK